MRTFNAGDLHVVAFNKNCARQERALLFVTVTGGAGQNLYMYSQDGPIDANYTLDENGKVTIDISELVRTYNDGGVGIEDKRGDTVNIQWSAVWNVNPFEMVKPYNDVLENNIRDVYANDMVIIPPSFTLRSSNNINVIHEIRGNDLDTTWYIPNGQASQKVQMTSQKVVIRQNVNYYDLCDSDSDYESMAHFVIADKECGRQYAWVQWIGRSGSLKRAMFEVRNVTYASDSDVKFATIDNSFHTLKGQVMSLDLCLDALNAYDYWYYSDVITSSDVRVACVINTAYYDMQADSLTEICRVYVTDKKAKMPNGDGETFDLKVNVNYRKYDTI